MRKLLFFIPLAAIIFFSCNTSSPDIKSLRSLLNEDSLKAENFTIDINKDTLLHTINGAWLKIDKGTFSSDNGKAVLEIKEAFSMQQIIKAGLTTQSNGQPLASGGMIYVNAAAGQKVTINKPFKIAVPSGYLEKDMQLYKGEKTADGNINWKGPKNLDDNMQLSAMKKGEVLFKQKCASCHGIGKEESGPDLANFSKRFPSLYGEGNYVPEHYFKKQFVPYSIDEPIADTSKRRYDYDHRWSDPYICNLITLFNNKEIDLSDDFNKNYKNWEYIYNYIENESNRRNLPYPRHAYLDSCIDSCNRFKQLKEELEQKKVIAEIKRKNLVNENGPLVDRKPDPTWESNNNVPPPDFSKKVQPGYYPATYYQFTIETFGWFNVDMLLNKKEGVEESELFVRIAGTYREKIKIYLIIPSAKVLGEGGPSENNNDEYAFFNRNGTIPLPQNAKAYILAVTETEQSIAFALKEFTTQAKQEFQISLNASTKQEFAKVIESIGADQLSIKLEDSKNSVAIRDADKTIKQLEEELKKAENLKPKRCDCDCGATPPQTTMPGVNEAKN
ncbi:MAG: cytochrome c [Chitinophagaceae bacterium]|nr:cytochrome c [Chitinophagaceae bacterium]